MMYGLTTSPTDRLLQKEVIPMFLRTLAVAFVAMRWLLVSQTTPQPGQAAPQLGQLGPTSLFPTPLVHLSHYPNYKGRDPVAADVQQRQADGPPRT